MSYESILRAMELNMDGIDPASSAAALYAYRLCKERERTGATQVDAAAAGQISVSLFGHYETMRRIPTLDASVRFDAYFALPEYFTDLQPLVVREAGTIARLLEFIEQEEHADSIRLYQPVLIPGLFQDEPYAREVLSAGTRPDQLERLVATRVGRQEIFRRDNPPSVVAVIHERALREVVGNPDIMRAQLAHLLKLGAEPGIDIQVLPASARRYVTQEFHLLGYAEGGDLAYAAAAGGHDRVIVQPQEVHRLGVLFDRVRSLALTTEDSYRLILTIMESL